MCTFQIPATAMAIAAMAYSAPLITRDCLKKHKNHSHNQVIKRNHKDYKKTISGEGRGGDLLHLGQGAEGRQEPGRHHHHASPLVLGAVGERPHHRVQSGQVGSSASWPKFMMQKQV